MGACPGKSARAAAVPQFGMDGGGVNGLFISWMPSGISYPGLGARLMVDHPRLKTANFWSQAL